MTITISTLKQQLFNSSWSYQFAIIVAVISSLLVGLTINQLRQSSQLINTDAQSLEQQIITPTIAETTSIAEWHLFSALLPEQINLQDLPTTLLALELKGVIINKNHQQTSAIITVAGGQEDFYVIGDTVPGGATIYNILGDRIVLQRDSRLEILTLPDEPIKQEI